ncbi:MAG: immune inhibitor A [Anaerolineae bacterium]
MKRTSARLAVLIAALILICAAPAAAQVSESTVDYPTADALNAAVLPPRDRVDLARRLLGITDIPPTPASAVARQVGERQAFTAANSSTNITFTVKATLRVVGEHIYLWVEDGAGVSDSDLQALAREFDTVIYPDVRSLWGSEDDPGVDGDPRIYGLFAHNLGASTAAYFASDHTYPKVVVPVSNEHEMFFFNLDALGTSLYLHGVESIVAHEFQHMIRANLQVNAETWLNEGLSEFTQFYLYGDVDSNIVSFLYQPNTQLDDWNAEPGARSANYGAASLFMIYFYQRYGLDGMRALSAETAPRGLQAVDDVLRARDEQDADDFFADWVLANALSDEDYADGRYGYVGLPPLLTPPPVATVTTYPFDYDGATNQYATSYFALTNLDGAHALDLSIQSPASVSLIPTTAASGAHVWYSNRGDMADSRLTRAFDLTGTAHTTLRYNIWHDLETSWDYGYVMVSDDGGASWDVLPTPHTTTDDPHGVTYGAGYTGASGGWLSESLSLDAYAGRQILIRFEMITDDAVTRPGMALDDVSIPEIGYASDFEGGGDDWQAEGWLWMDNRLPQQGWVQVAQQSGADTVDVERWQIDGDPHRIKLAAGVNQVLVAVSPLAPVTTVPMPYTLSVGAS